MVTLMSGSISLICLTTWLCLLLLGIKYFVCTEVCFRFFSLGAMMMANSYSLLFVLFIGLSPGVIRLDHAKLLNRYTSIPNEGAIVDMLWSCPKAKLVGFTPATNGNGYLFGKDCVEKFLTVNSLEHIIRSHQLCADGYQVCVEFCAVLHFLIFVN